jgi:hypothetical protein
MVSLQLLLLTDPSKVQRSLHINLLIFESGMATTLSQININLLIFESGMAPTLSQIYINL